MSHHNWYRNETWNGEIEKTFLEKLERARSQRDQYLKIQIFYLTEKHPQQALKLCQAYHDTRTDKSWDLEVKEYAAKAHKMLGQVPIALEIYRDILQHDEAQPFFPHSVLLDVPLLIAHQGKTSDFHFAWETIKRAQKHLSRRGVVFAHDTFMLNAAQALLHSRERSKDQAKKHAYEALRAASTHASGLRYHPGIGLVGSEHKDTVLSLKFITTGIPFWILRLSAQLEVLFQRLRTT